MRDIFNISWDFRKLIILALVIGLLQGASGTGLALTAQEEKQIGKRILQEIEMKQGLVNDPVLQVFLDRVGRSLVAEAGPSPFEFEFHMVKGQDPNAFAVPGGYIFVTTGLLVLAEDEDEVAGVLSHEIAHVTSRHISQIFDQAKRFNLASMAAILAAVLVGRGGPGTEAAIAATMATQETWLLKYTRDHETEADQKGLQTAAKAGYQPEGIVRFMGRLQKYNMTAGPNIPAYLLTHPAFDSRISLMETMLRADPKPPAAPPFPERYRWIQTQAFVIEREPHVAIAHFESMIRANPNDVFGIYGLALTYQKAGRFNKAIEILQEALSKAPDKPVLLTSLGVGYFLAGNIDASINTLERVRSLPEKGQEGELLGLYYLGRGYQEKGAFSKALPCFQRVQKELPGLVDVYLNLGSVHGRMGKEGQSHYFYGKYFKLKGDGKSALLHFRKALQFLDRGSPEWDESQKEIKDLTQGEKPQR
jgi:beta-barrel assembly-enhancing protease